MLGGHLILGAAMFVQEVNKIHISLPFEVDSPVGFSIKGLINISGDNCRQVQILSS